MSGLPKGWTSCSLQELLISLESGSRPKGGVRGIAEGIPSIGGEHLTYKGGFDFSSIKFIPKDFAEQMNKGRIELNDILVVKDGATTGKTAFVSKDFPYSLAFVNEHVFICRPSKLIEPRFLFRYLVSKEGQDRILENFQGSAQGGINLSFAQNTKIPLPPFNEQKRIVANLEALLLQVEASKERLEKIPKILKRFRQSVLASAYSGRLTVDWRGEENLSNWTETFLEKVIEGKPKNGYSAKPVGYETKFRVLTLTATTSGRFIDKHFKYFDEMISDDSQFWLQPNDILVQRGNTIEYVGVSAIYEGEPNQFIYPDLMMRLRANEKTLTKFLYYWLSWEKIRNYFRENATGTAGNMPKINQVTLINTPILLPPLPEQKEIVRRVEDLFKFADSIDERYKQAKTQVDKLTNSILFKAFRGELVPQNEADEPAVELLKQIKNVKETETSKPQKKIRQKKMKLSKEQIIEIIKELPETNFSFDTLREKVSSDYESLKEILFEILSDNKPVLKQVFDVDTKSIVFTRNL